MDDIKIFNQHIASINQDILSMNRALDILKREGLNNLENKMLLDRTILMLENNIQFKHNLIEEGKKWLAAELNKKESE